MSAPRIPITDLASAGALADADLVPVVQSGTTKKTTAADLRAIPQGLLSARPAASSVPNGATYFATDVDGGTLYTEVSNAWVTVGSVGGLQAGTVLTSVWPTSIATVSASLFGLTRVTELTTPAFTMPTREVRVMTPQMAATITSGYDVVLRIHVDTAGAGTYTAMQIQGPTQIKANTVTAAYWPPMTVNIPHSIVPAGTASVRVAIFVQVIDLTARNVTIAANPGTNNVQAGIDVVLR